MDQSEYEYWGMKASTWDLFHGGTSEWDDLQFYRDLIRKSGEPALDVGCGTGRLLLDYLAQGIDIDGVDLSPDMLRLCRTKAAEVGLTPRLFEQSMQALDLPRRYRTIIVPSSSFQLLIEPADSKAAMLSFLRHLASGGTLCMPFVFSYTGPATADTIVEDWSCSREGVRSSDGALVRLRRRTVFDLKERLEHTEDRFEVICDGKVVLSEEHVRSPATRWYTQQEARDLYIAAGFTDVRLFSGFSFRLASSSDTLFCVLGKKA
jgi:SAM-dependent methyltransferase